MRKINIAIEGPAASGKGTVSWLLSQKLEYLYIDTGAMYRSLSLACLRAGIDKTDEDAVTKYVHTLKLEYNQTTDPTKYKCQVLINGEDVSPYIRSSEVSSYVHFLAGYDTARIPVMTIQKALIANKGVVVEGQSIVEEVLPDAELKVFLTASLEIRAQRRHNDLLKLGEDVSVEDIEKKLLERDTYDMTREHGRLTIKSDALYLDTSNLTIDEVVNTLYIKAQEIINSA